MIIEFAMPLFGGWDGARDRVLGMSWDADVRADALRSLELFRDHLGPDWPGWGSGWPLASQFFTRYQGQAPEGVRVYRMANHFAEDPGFSDWMVHAASADSKHHSAALFELEIADSLRRAGHRTRFLAPGTTAAAKGVHPTPDLTTVPATREVLVECTRGQAGEPLRQAHFVVDAIREFRGDGPFARSAHVHFGDHVPAQAASARFDEIRAAMATSCRTGERVELEGIGVISAMPDAPTSETNGGLLVGNSERDVIQLLRSVRNKIAGGQLRTGASVIVVHAHHLWGLQPDQFEGIATWVREKIEAALQRAPHVGGVFVFEKWMSASPREFLHDVLDGRLTHTNGISRAILAVPNPNARVPLEDDELITLANAFAPF